MQFGLFNNLFGVRSDVPHMRLPEALVADESEGFFYWRDAMYRIGGRTEALDGVQTPDGNPILRYHYHRSEAGLEYLFAFTADHAYLWSGSAWDEMFACASSCETWSTADFGQYVVATNDLDKVQYWDDASPATAFAPLGGTNGIDYDGSHYLTRARHVVAHWHYLHLLCTTEDGTLYANLDRWCDAGDLTSWREDHPTGGDANYRQLGPSDEIVAVGIYNVQGANQLIAFTRHGVNAAWLVADDLVYESHDLLSSEGCAAPGSVVNGPDGHLYYMSLNAAGVKQVRRVYDPQPLSYDVQPLLDRMHPTLCSGAVGCYMGRWRQLWWSIPKGGDSTANDLVLIYSLETGTWQPPWPVAITAFGSYSRQSSSYIDDNSDIIDSVADKIDSFAPVTGEPASLSADGDGYTWQHAGAAQDAGGDLTGSLVLAVTFGGELHRYKRLHGLWLWFVAYTGTTYTASVSLRKGDSASYVTLGTVSLAGNGRTVRQYIGCDKRLRDGHLKITAANPCGFLGAVLDYDLQGTR